LQALGDAVQLGIALTAFKSFCGSIKAKHFAGASASSAHTPTTEVTKGIQYPLALEKFECEFAIECLIKKPSGLLATDRKRCESNSAFNEFNAVARFASGDGNFARKPF
jgi:hypothetical protein